MIFVQIFFKRITKFSQDYLTLLAWLSNKAIIFYPSQLSLSSYALTFDCLDRCDLLIHFYFPQNCLWACAEWNALYTTQITQKAKKFHDGFLRLSVCGSYMDQVCLSLLYCETSQNILIFVYLKILNIYQYHFQHPFLMGSGHLFFSWPMHVNNMIHCKYVTKTCLFKLFYSVSFYGEYSLQWKRDVLHLIIYE